MSCKSDIPAYALFVFSRIDEVQHHASCKLALRADRRSQSSRGLYKQLFTMLLGENNKSFKFYLLRFALTKIC